MFDKFNLPINLAKSKALVFGNKYPRKKFVKDIFT